jgi:hypothetical protein
MVMNNIFGRPFQPRRIISNPSDESFREGGAKGDLGVKI